ncbi:gp87 [Mycobacterium phage Rizal]|uniref:Uncharacterized protein n=2 Tax=Bixzunavirus Bxz1 TaxID=2006134 RepID=B5LK73_9CAUD|nr:gp87 [Mycobacterium phage Rizal]ACH62319.1 hypothetical protein RIZAL_87 [Mycobacterium phage Rizal]AER25452.1 hypothetical protein WALLY_88 [Mycobacterium phage Wally]QAY11117.1 hypothetical protein SEA_NAPOLEON13_85 [Mycobacterium phage Napoleon13]
MRDLCFGCKGFKEIVHTESGTGHPYCQECALMQPPTSDEWALVLLNAPWSPFSAPFRPGDKVEARTAGQIFDGVGEVVDMSVSLEHGGTPVYPTFKVVLTEKAHDLAPDEAWYTECCLTRVE